MVVGTVGPVTQVKNLPNVLNSANLSGDILLWLQLRNWTGWCKVYWRKGIKWVGTQDVTTNQLTEIMILVQLKFTVCW